MINDPDLIVNEGQVIITIRRQMNVLWKKYI